MTPVRTLLESNHDHPYTTFTLAMRSGTLCDERGAEGLTNLSAGMLLRGTELRTRSALAEEIDRLGASVDIAAGKESVLIRGDALKRNLVPVLDVLEEALSRATFPKEEIEKLRRQTQAEIRNLRNHDEALARAFFFKLLYDGHPYGRPSRGTTASLEGLRRDDILSARGRLLRRGHLIFACSGDVDEDEIERLADHHLAGVPDGEAPACPFPPMREPVGRTVLLLNKPERTQSQIVIGHLAIPAAHPDYFPLLIANTVFGGTFTARLSKEIRERRGWSYGAYSHLSTSRRTGFFSMRYYPNDADTLPALRRGLELYEELARDGITAEEQRFAVSYLVNHFPFRVDTAPKRLEQNLASILLGRPDDFVERYVDHLQAVTLDDVNAAIRRHLKPQDLVITVLCTATAKLQAALARLPGVRNTLVHPYDEEWEPADSPEDARR